MFDLCDASWVRGDTLIGTQVNQSVGWFHEYWLSRSIEWYSPSSIMTTADPPIQSKVQCVRAKSGALHL